MSHHWEPEVDTDSSHWGLQNSSLHCNIQAWVTALIYSPFSLFIFLLTFLEALLKSLSFLWVFVLPIYPCLWSSTKPTGLSSSANGTGNKIIMRKKQIFNLKTVYYKGSYKTLTLIKFSAISNILTQYLINIYSSNVYLTVKL